MVSPRTPNEIVKWFALTHSHDVLADWSFDDGQATLWIYEGVDLDVRPLEAEGILTRVKKVPN